MNKMKTGLFFLLLVIVCSSCAVFRQGEETGGETSYRVTLLLAPADGRISLYGLSGTCRGDQSWCLPQGAGMVTVTLRSAGGPGELRQRLYASGVTVLEIVPIKIMSNE